MVVHARKAAGVDITRKAAYLALIDPGMSLFDSGSALAFEVNCSLHYYHRLSQADGTDPADLSRLLFLFFFLLGCGGDNGIRYICRHLFIVSRDGGEGRPALRH